MEEKKDPSNYEYFNMRKGINFPFDKYLKYIKENIEVLDPDQDPKEITNPEVIRLLLKECSKKIKKIKKEEEEEKK